MSLKVTFSAARLLSFSRNGKRGGVAKFRAVVNAHICEKLEWPEPDERLTSSSPEADLAARVIEIVPKDKELRKWEMQLERQRVHNFEIIRREVEGKRGKGFRHELSFDVAFGDPLGCAKLEVLMLKIGQAKCGLIVAYEPKAEQTANEEQRQAVLN